MNEVAEQMIKYSETEKQALILVIMTLEKELERLRAALRGEAPLDEWEGAE